MSRVNLALGEQTCPIRLLVVNPYTHHLCQLCNGPFRLTISRLVSSSG